MSNVSKNNKINFSKELQSFKLKDAIGKSIVCEDGLQRRVVEITNSYRYPWRAIINEQDEDSRAGHFVNIFSLCSQIISNYVPTKDEQEAFARSVRMSFKVGEQGITNSHPLDKHNGKIILA